MSAEKPTQPVNPASDKAARDNRSNQLNPNNDTYWKGRGQSPPPSKPSGSSSGSR